MITVPKMINAVEQIAAEEPGYEKGHDGSDNLCDCIGLIIGALKRCGERWRGLRGSNYAARNELKNLIEKIRDSAILQPGDIVFKAHEPNQTGYDLPERYRTGGSSYNGDLRDYYHVGIVVSTNPLRIRHMTSPKPKMDTKIGNWGWFGKLKMIDYHGGEKTVTAKVVLPAGRSGKTVNMREAPSTSAGIMKKVPVGTEVDLIEDRGQWCQIGYAGNTGFMMSDYLEYGQQDETGGADISPEELRMIDEYLSNIEKAVQEIASWADAIGSITGRG